MSDPVAPRTHTLCDALQAASRLLAVCKPNPRKSRGRKHAQLDDDDDLEIIGYMPPPACPLVESYSPIHGVSLFHHATLPLTF